MLDGVCAGRGRVSGEGACWEEAPLRNERVLLGGGAEGASEGEGRVLGGAERRGRVLGVRNGGVGCRTGHALVRGGACCGCPL